MFDRRALPGLVCITLGALAIVTAAVGCGVCSIPEDAGTPGCGHLVAAHEAKQAAEVIEPPQATVEVVSELQRKVKSLESYAQKLAEIADQQALLLSRANAEHAKQFAEVSRRVDDIAEAQTYLTPRSLVVDLAERVSDLERQAADVPPRLPPSTEPPKVAAADPKPAHLVEPVAVIPKAPREFDGVAITAHTTTSCPPCETFKRQDSPALELLGASVSIPDPNPREAGPFPWYEVRDRGGRLLPVHRGKLDAATLRALLKAHR